jgi:MYXO-CTERM domain-containing protein
MKGAFSAVAMLLFALPAPASANGRFPAPTSITFRTGSSTDVLLGTTFGVLISRDGGASWRWLCEQVVGYGGNYDPYWIWHADGTILATTFEGISVSEDGGCTWSKAAGTAGIFIDDLQAHPADPSVVLVTTVEQARTTKLLRSRDGGRTFDSTPLLSLENRFLSGVRFAPSDPRHLYVAAYWANPWQGWILHSADGGGTWEEHPLTLSPDQPVKVVGVDPQDPAVLFLWRLGVAQDTILRSADSGRSFEPVLTASDQLLGFFIEPGGQRVYASGVNLGIHRSVDRGRTFALLAGAPHGGCLGGQGTSLYSCATWAQDGFAVGRSRDGTTFEAYLRWFNEIDGPLECPDGTPTRTRCDPQWPQVAALFQIPVGSDGGVADGGTDGGADGGAASPRGKAGCGCGAAGATGGPGLAVLAALGLLARWRRK